MFAISLVSLFGYHIFLISQNRTTLEAFRPPVFVNGKADKKGFFLGKLNNFREVLGDRPLLWFVPVFTSLGDGLTYPQTCYMVDEEMGTEDSDGYDDFNDQNNCRLQSHRFQEDLSFQDGLSEDDLEGENELLLPNYNRTKHKGLSRPNLQVQQP